MQLKVTTCVIVGALGALAAPWVIHAQSPTPQVDTSAKAVINKAVEYLKTYKESLKYVLADESTSQRVFNALGREVARRETSGEYFMTYLEADGGWIGVRDIAKVDGAPVENRDNLRDLLTQASFARIGRQLVERNSRYNIGSILRTFNDPMMPLLILDDKHRVRCKFEVKKLEGKSAGPSVTLAFNERDEPTLVKTADGRRIYSKGEFKIDATTGRVESATISLKDGATTATMTTVFTEDEKLGLWVPSVLTEEYDHRSSRSAERVAAVSTYTNYRRFNVKVVIK